MEQLFEAIAPALIGIGSTILVLAMVVVIHELGHYWAGRMLGIHALDFSFGFGRVLFSRRDRRGTTWKVCLLPLGGYVRFLGNDDLMGGQDAEEEDFPDTAIYRNRSRLERAWVVLAGPLANLVLGFTLLTAITAIQGVPTVGNKIGKVDDASVAAKLDIHPGDRIVRIGNHQIELFADIRPALDDVAGGVEIEIDRQGERKVMHLHRFTEAGSMKLGIRSAAPEYRAVSMVEAAEQGAKATWSLVTASLSAIGGAVFQGNMEQIGGLLSIGEATSGAVEIAGLHGLALVAASISIGLFVMNLLPMPILDGGHLLRYAAEAITRRSMGQRASLWFVSLGMAAMAVLMLVTNGNDFLRATGISFSDVSEWLKHLV